MSNSSLRSGNLRVSPCFTDLVRAPSGQYQRFHMINRVCAGVMRCDHSLTAAEVYRAKPDQNKTEHESGPCLNHSCCLLSAWETVLQQVHNMTPVLSVKPETCSESWHRPWSRPYLWPSSPAPQKKRKLKFSFLYQMLHQLSLSDSPAVMLHGDVTSNRPACDSKPAIGIRKTQQTRQSSPCSEHQAKADTVRSGCLIFYNQQLIFIFCKCSHWTSLPKNISLKRLHPEQTAVDSGAC